MFGRAFDEPAGEEIARGAVPLRPRWTRIEGAAQVWNEVPSAALATPGVDAVVGTIRTGVDQVDPVADPLVARPAIGDPAPAAK